MTGASYERRGVRGWGTRDMLVVAAMGVALGVAYVPINYVYVLLESALGPLGVPLVAGFSYLPGLMALYVVRRPGAAILVGVFVGFVQAAFSPFGWVAVVFWVILGAACEVVFLLTRYRVFRLPVLMVGGATAGLIALALSYVPSGYLDLAPAVQLALIAGYALSGALLGGLLAKGLADALAKTGVLAAYPIGRGRESGADAVDTLEARENGRREA